MGRGKEWSDEEVEELERLIFDEGYTAKEAAHRLGRTVTSVTSKLGNEKALLEGKFAQKWTKKDDEMLLNGWLVDAETIPIIAKKLGKTAKEVKRRLHRFGYEYIETLLETYVVCPFYTGEKNAGMASKERNPKINCKCDENGTIQNAILMFDKSKNCKIYMRRYCLGHWAECKMAKMICDAYEKQGIKQIDNK